jgi:peptidoglycan/xylan/chitin deacetylase (PgdA/CDA1 family)
MVSVSLTYDDGPGPHTERLLDILRAHGVKATFYLLGSNAEQYPKTVERMAAEGHTLGNHTYSHTWQPGDSLQAFLDELRKTDLIICRAMGWALDDPRRPAIPFRLPGGPKPGDARLMILTGIGRAHSHWTGEFADWTPRTPEELFRDMKLHVRRSAARSLNAVLLLHDSAPPTEEFRDRSASVEATRLFLEDGVLAA